MSEFQPGDIVDIVIKGVRIDFPGNDAVLPSFVGEHGSSYPIPARAEITVRPLPDNWPPLPGDLWRLEEDEPFAWEKPEWQRAQGLFFARLVQGPFDEHPEDLVPFLELTHAVTQYTLTEPEDLLTLGRWTLVRREQATPAK
jgi:hypothetical protein